MKMKSTYIKPYTEEVKLNANNLLDDIEWNGTSKTRGANESDAKANAWTDDEESSWEEERQ